MYNLLLVPFVFVNMAFVPCPAYPPVRDDRGVLMYYSCYVPETNTVYLARQDRHDRPTIIHELGHAYGYQVANRHGEYFADQYACCELQDPRRNLRLCRWLLRRSASHAVAKAASQQLAP